MIAAAPGELHCIKNTGDELLQAVCIFSPPVDRGRAAPPRPGCCGRCPGALTAFLAESYKSTFCFFMQKRKSQWAEQVPL